MRERLNSSFGLIIPELDDQRRAELARRFPLISDADVDALLDRFVTYRAANDAEPKPSDFKRELERFNKVLAAFVASARDFSETDGWSWAANRISPIKPDLLKDVVAALAPVSNGLPSVIDRIGAGRPQSAMAVLIDGACQLAESAKLAVDSTDNGAVVFLVKIISETAGAPAGDASRAVRERLAEKAR